MSKISGDDGSFSSGEEVQQLLQKKQKLQNHPHSSSGTGAAGPSTASKSNDSSSQQPQQPPVKKKRNLPGTPDPNAEVVALSPTTLMATNRFVCEICNKGFQRDQNLQLHRRGHNLPWKLRQRTTTEVKKRVYICPEPSCVHHNPARALGDLTGIKKHFSRKHGEKKWKCDKCSKKYAVQSDRKAHQKTCGTREYKCDCGTIFSRRDSFITHRAFCDALAEEKTKVNQGLMDNNMGSELMNNPTNNTSIGGISDFNSLNPLKSLQQELVPIPFKSMSVGGGAGGMFSSSSGALFGSPRNMSPSSAASLQLSPNTSPGFNYLQDSKNGLQISGSAHVSATALLQKATQMGATVSNSINSPVMQKGFGSPMAGHDSIRSLCFGAIQPQGNPFDHFTSPADQSNMVGIGDGGFSNPIMEKGPQEMPHGSHLFQAATGGSSINDMGMITSMFITSRDQTTMERDLTGQSNMANLHDFMGIGGQRGAHLHEQQQQQRLELEVMSQQQRFMNHFQHQLSHGDSAIEKPLWDV
ncbi:hypothetical protein SLEP1_g1260 [Rubroshorea leprosula]|uniref:C2H2-type domain-containing protein n=1 Tax=Rubroshorea leprosula TaxID=152421 RepID=A0AAV5HNQ6_9ROSI|nr:hypothetical protein SLEP1_g1260 [Rubroshorea leprosula]